VTHSKHELQRHLDRQREAGGVERKIAISDVGWKARVRCEGIGWTTLFLPQSREAVVVINGSGRTFNLILLRLQKECWDLAEVSILIAQITGLPCDHEFEIDSVDRDRIEKIDKCFYQYSAAFFHNQGLQDLSHLG